MSPSAGACGRPGPQVPSPAPRGTDSSPLRCCRRLLLPLRRTGHAGRVPGSLLPNSGSARGAAVVPSSPGTSPHTRAQEPMGWLRHCTPGQLGASPPGASPQGSRPLLEPQGPSAPCLRTVVPSPHTSASAGSIPIRSQGCREGTAPRLNGAGAAGGGLKPEPHRGTRTMGNLSPHLQPPLGSRTQNVPLRGTCGFQAARPRPLGPPHREPAASRHKGIGSWGCGPLLRRKQIVHWAILFCWKSIWTGSFSFGPAPGQRVKSQLQASLSRPHHVTVYSSSRWFLQI